MFIVEENGLTIQSTIVIHHTPPLMLGLVSEIMYNVECRQEVVIVKLQLEKNITLSQLTSLLDGVLLIYPTRFISSV